MREIKFRAWHTVAKKMYSAEEIGRDQLTIMPDGQGFINVSGTDTRLSHLIPEMTPMQFTGLKDKNGREIYEGDIVKYKNISGYSAEDDYQNSADNVERIGEIKFVGGEFYPRPDGSYPEDGYYSWRNWDFEIIGNIYENGELVK